MEDAEINYDDYSMEQILQAIKVLASMPQNKKNVLQMASTLGIHMCKLQKEYGYPPIFPIELIPLPRQVFKDWCFNYASMIVRSQNILKLYQQDAALYFTRFRELTIAQWEAIKSNSVENLVLYNAEMRDKRLSSLKISTEFKNIIDAYRSDYDSESTNLYSYLKSSKSAGYMISLLFLGILNFTIIYLMVMTIDKLTT